MIQLKNATKYFYTNGEKKYILKGVDLTIPDGQNIGILGRNGAGKSTLLRMLGGIDYPTSGEITSNKSFSWPMGLQGGFQGSMTGRQNVKFVGRVYGKSHDEINELLDSVQKFADIGDYFDMPIKTYSSGMRSRLSFGLSLAFDFDYLIIDETLSVGDTVFKEKAKKALRDKISTCNILLVSHSNKTLKELCTAGIVLNNGLLEYYEDIKDAIKVYYDQNHIMKITPKTVFCNDGKSFENIKEAASFYEVNPISIKKAINRNNGSHVYLKKVFAQGKKEFHPFQAYENMNIVSSDGMCFKNIKQVIDFYTQDDDVSVHELKELFQKEKMIHDELGIELFYIKEYL